MSEAAAPSGFRWLWLHPVHTTESGGTSSSSTAPAPWSLPRSEEAAFKMRGRHECLGNLLQRASQGTTLSTARLPPADAKAEAIYPGPDEQGPVLFFSGGRLQGASATGETTVNIPLLMADLVYMTAAKSPESDRPWYLLVLAPRACPVKPKDDEPPSKEAGDFMPFMDIWMLYTAPVEHSDFLRLLFEFGSRGALRWDLHECYTITEKSLGVGGCGTVYLGQSRMKLAAPKDTTKVDIPAVPQVAVKKLNKSGGVTEEINIRSEIEFLAVARGHPCISALFGVFCYSEVGGESRGAAIRWNIVMPLYSEGDLFDYLAANGAMKETTAVTLMLCLLSALTHLHRLGVVHRDVKAENILLANNKAVLSDVGIAAFLKDEEAMQRRVGSPGYAPPEVVTDLPYDEKVDVFGAGAVLFFALSNTLPFPGKTLKKVLELTARCKVKYDPALFGDFSGSIIQLLKALLQRDPTKRPSARKSFKALWTMASQKPEIQRSSVARITLQAVDDFDSLAATNLESIRTKSERLPKDKVKRTTSEKGAPGQAVSVVASEEPQEPRESSKEATTAPNLPGTLDGAAKPELVPVPPAGPKPSSSGGTLSYLKNRLGWSKSPSSGGVTGESSQGMKSQ
mmetsp:Transcript_19677/g.45784  ORF Transcript_19677/g.45784 Transcript_19677/m.45784 type:complete len:625 (-) Transcript_19677:326-2200(-)